MEGTPQAVAAFLREHLADLDKGQLGEYLGHHEDFAVGVFYSLTLPWSARKSFWRGLQGLDNSALQDLYILPGPKAIVTLNGSAEKGCGKCLPGLHCKTLAGALNWVISSIPGPLNLTGIY